MSLPPFSLGACGCRAAAAGDCTFRVRFHREEGYHADTAMVIHNFQTSNGLFSLYGENVIDQKISAYRHQGHWEVRAPLNGPSNNVIVQVTFLNLGGANPPVFENLNETCRFFVGVAITTVGAPLGTQWFKTDGSPARNLVPFPTGPDGRPTGYQDVVQEGNRSGNQIVNRFTIPTHFIPQSDESREYEARITIPTHQFGEVTGVTPYDAAQLPVNHLQVLCVKITVP